MTLEDEITAVVRNQGISDAMDELSARILRDSKIIAAGDDLADAVMHYMVDFVKEGPYREESTKRLVDAVWRYQETRGVRP